MRERRAAGMNVGSASVVMVFAILCLTIFAVLSLVTANNEKRLAETYADSVTAFYQAEARGAAMLEQIRQGEVPEVPLTERQIDGMRCLSYQIPVGDSQLLDVELREETKGWTVTRWRVLPAEEWKADESIPVWDGE